MRLEEEVILPAAQRVLDDQDWAELDATYDRLFTRIATCAPAPIGLGEEA